METLQELAVAIREHDISPSELLEKTLSRIEKNKDLNAIVALNVSHARTQAQQADREVVEGYRGPLHGIPVTVKDTFATSHIPTSFGMPFRYRCSKNAELVNRLQNAGAIVFGKTNLPAMSFDWQAKHPRYGTTRHPWMQDCSPGGSSGGSAAALAAQLVPYEIGSDIAGSLRVPAALCGVNTIRPTESTISLEGHMAVPMSRPLTNLLTAGPMARSIEDLKIVFDVVTDLSAPEEYKPLTRVMVQTHFPGASIEKNVADTIDSAIARLTQAGVEIVEARPEIDYIEALKVWGHICGYELGRSTPLYVPRFLKPLYKTFFEKRYSKHVFSTSIGEGMAMSEKEYQTVLAKRDELVQRFDDYLADVDLFITPVLGVGSIPICKTGSDFGVDGVQVPYADPIAIYNCSFAVFAHPVVVVNAGKSDRDFPIGVQLHGRRFGDYQLLEHAQRISEIFQ